MKLDIFELKIFIGNKLYVKLKIKDHENSKYLALGSDGSLYIATLDAKQEPSFFEIAGDFDSALFVKKSRIAAINKNGAVSIYKFNEETNEGFCNILKIHEFNAHYDKIVFIGS